MDLIATGAASIDSSRSVGALATLSADFSTFLTLLTTQLQNQDPLDPMSSSEFTSQLVQFSAVEQAIATNKNLEQLISLSTSERLNNAVGFLGYDVRARGSATRLENGAASWQYQQDLLMKTVSLLVTDSTGKIVYIAAGETNPGLHQFDWDGKDNAGSELPEGEYSLSASGASIAGDSITPVVFVTGRVTGVETVEGEPMLTVNGAQIPLSHVLSILETVEAETTL